MIASTFLFLASLSAGAKIYYTADGTTVPTAASTEYVGPLTITADTTYQAIAVADGKAPSSVTTYTAAYVVGDTTIDPVGTTFPFAADISAAQSDDWGSPYGTLAWAKEDPAGTDGVLVLKGEAAAPASAVKTVLTLNLPAPVATLTGISLRIKVPASMASDWYQALTVIARQGDGWSNNSSGEIKFPAVPFAADTWQTVTLAPSDFAAAPADLRALTLQVYRNFGAGATSLGDIQIDWVKVQ